MRGELFHNVLNMIVGRRAADEQLFGDFDGRFAPGKQPQDFHLALCQIGRAARRFFARKDLADVDLRQARFADDEIAHQQFESFVYIRRSDNVKRVRISGGGFVNDDDRNIAPLTPVARPDLDVVAFDGLMIFGALLNGAVFAAGAPAFVNAVQNFAAGFADGFTRPEAEKFRRRAVPGGDQAVRRERERGVRRAFDKFSDFS